MRKTWTDPTANPTLFNGATGRPSMIWRIASTVYTTWEQQREPDVFTDRIAVDPPIMAQCVEHLEGISLDRTELDTKGMAFEEFMGSFFKGDFGQYFTPRELIAFCVAALDPKRTDLVLDPACGSGGFLLYAMDHVRRQADKLYKPDSLEPLPILARLCQGQSLRPENKRKTDPRLQDEHDHP